MHFKDLAPNCTFNRGGELYVKLPHVVPLVVVRDQKLFCNAVNLAPRGATPMLIDHCVEITADMLANHRDIEDALRTASHTGDRKHLPLVLPAKYDRQFVNAVLLGAPVTFISAF
ncbi:MAG: hypothetical protein RLZZ347_498 [Candidatus Parcubacteria bacterium]|jgi:hypothetical protein